MLLLSLLGCLRFYTPEDTGTDSAGPPPLPDPIVVWGDLHNHSNLSHDGCENPGDRCRPDAAEPAEATFDNATANGLAFVALTDHAEFGAWSMAESTTTVDIWETMIDLVSDAEAGPTFGVLGYEWTSACTEGVGDDYQATHRTVILEAASTCPEWRIPSCHPTEGAIVLGSERYVYSSFDPAIYPSDLLARLRQVPLDDATCDTRWAAWFHHTAQSRPAWVDWGTELSWVEGDTVVEIASEHGSSECVDSSTDGCDWRFSEFHESNGSIQYMLQMGHKLGFVGGTDNHMAEPGRHGLGGGYVRDLDEPDSAAPWHTQFSSGTITGAISYDPAFDRGDLFDAIAARHTVVASWPATGLMIYATGADGERYLPGDDVPRTAMPLYLTITLDDPTVTEWYAEVVDEEGQPDLSYTVDIPANGARYVRIRAWIPEDTVGGDTATSDREEHRVFASPFFALDDGDTGATSAG
jgi:hypothetical protein